MISGALGTELPDAPLPRSLRRNVSCVRRRAELSRATGLKLAVPRTFMRPNLFGLAHEKLRRRGEKFLMDPPRLRDPSTSLEMTMNVEIVLTSNFGERSFGLPVTLTDRARPERTCYPRSSHVILAQFHPHSNVLVQQIEQVFRMLAEVVVAVVDDAKLSSILSAIHGAGMGHVARGIRSQQSSRSGRGAARGNVREQLRHNGIPVEQIPEALEGAERLLVVNAAARSTSTADLMLQHGAIAVWIVSPAGVWREIDDRAEMMVADAQLSPVLAVSGLKPTSPIPDSPVVLSGKQDPAVQPE